MYKGVSYVSPQQGHVTSGDNFTPRCSFMPDQCHFSDGECGWSGLFFCSCAQFHSWSFHVRRDEREGRSLTPAQQKPLLRKLLSSSNLGELYLFIICSQAVLLSQGIVRRGNLSLPNPSSPSSSSSLPSPSCQAFVLFAVTLLHCSSEARETDRVVYWELRCNPQPSPKVKPRLISISSCHWIKWLCRATDFINTQIHLSLLPSFGSSWLYCPADEM